MTDYDFRSINDKEFEILVTDLLGARDGVRYERFKPGRDQGVDGRYFVAPGAETLVQAKHWPGSPLESLVRHLQKKELPKIQKLAPRRYILAVSHALSRADKVRIAEVLAPFLSDQSDILGREDLNDILAKHSDVERRHYNLWLSSTNVLQALLNKPIYERSAFAIDEIVASAPRYVPTKNHSLALERLERTGCVIITGAPGIGKTTLADHLCLHYLQRDFQLVRIAEEIREAEAVFERDREQVFYFDDFLGRNYMEALRGHEGSQVVQFIQRIARDRKKRFVLTSRTTILNQGKILNDVLTHNRLDRSEFEVTLESYTGMDKARMLYNHIWHSDLSQQFVDVLYEGKRYRAVIAHKNFNPRLIRFLTDSDRLASCAVNDYWKHVERLLENPAEVWQNQFEAQTDDFGRAVILLVVLNGRPMRQSELAESYARYVAMPNAGAWSGRRDFLVTLKHLAGSMLSRAMTHPMEALIDLFNPSIRDYVLHRYVDDIPSLRTGLSCLRTSSSLEVLIDLSANGLLPQQSMTQICRYLLKLARDERFLGYSAEYVATSCVQLINSKVPFAADDNLLVMGAFYLLDTEEANLSRHVLDVIAYAHAYGVIDDARVARFVKAACAQGPEAELLEMLGNIHQALPPALQVEVIPQLEHAGTSYFEDAGLDAFSLEEVFDPVSGPEDLEIVHENLRKMVDDRMRSFGVEISGAKIKAIIDSFRVEERADDYFRKQDYDEERHRDYIPREFGLDEIDDLFDRSR